MIDEPKVKDCPFCGLDGDHLAWRGKLGRIELIEHPNTDCILADFKCEDVEQWNKRASKMEPEAQADAEPQYQILNIGEYICEGDQTLERRGWKTVELSFVGYRVQASQEGKMRRPIK